jgi:hypothetical protein
VTLIEYRSGLIAMSPLMRPRRPDRTWTAASTTSHRWRVTPVLCEQVHQGRLLAPPNRRYRHQLARLSVAWRDVVLGGDLHRTRSLRTMDSVILYRGNPAVQDAAARHYPRFFRIPLPSAFGARPKRPPAATAITRTASTTSGDPSGVAPDPSFGARPPMAYNSTSPLQSGRSALLGTFQGVVVVDGGLW